MVHTPLDMGMAVLATAMARGLLTPRLMPTMATEAMVDMVLATPLATVLATAMVAMARGLLTLRLMPTMAMVDTDSVMADTAMVVLATYGKRSADAKPYYGYGGAYTGYGYGGYGLGLGYGYGK